MNSRFPTFLSTVLLMFSMSVTAQEQYINDGVVDLRHIDLHAESAALKGKAAFFGGVLLDPERFPNDIPRPEYIAFPNTWNEQKKSLHPGDGYATYWLRVLLPGQKRYALELPHFYSNYTLWIDGKKVASNGTVGTTPDTSVPQWLPQTVSFDAGADTIDLVIHVSNFHHALGGIRENILLGGEEILYFKRNVATTSYMVMVAILLLVFVIGLIVHLFAKADTGFLYLALLALTWAARGMFSNLYIAHNFIPGIPWETGVKIEYISLYLMMIWAVQLISTLFREEVNIIFKILFTSANVIFTFLTLLLDASVYTQFLPVYLSTAGFILLYAMYVLVRAILSGREGVWTMVTGLFLAVMLFTYDIISYEGFATFNPVVLNAGYIMIFVLLILALMYKPQARRKSSANMLRYEDLYSENRK